MKARIILFAIAGLLCGTCANAQSEAHYADQLVANKATIEAKTFNVPVPNGEPLALKARDLIAHLLDQGDVHRMLVPQELRGLDGNPNDSTPTFNDAQIASIMGQLRFAVDHPDATVLGETSLFGISDPNTGSIIGPDKQAAILDAIAQVIVDRVKEELALAYFDKMAVKMDSVRVIHHVCSTGVKPVRMCSLTELMPATQLIFKASRDHISSHVGATLQAAFVDDLEKFPAHFATSYGAGIATVEAASCKGTLTNEDYAVMMATKLLDGVANGRNWRAILEEFANTGATSASWKKRSAVIDLSLRLLESMSNTTGDGFELLALGNWDDERAMAYLGLLLSNPKVNTDLEVLGIKAKATDALIIARSVLADVDALASAAQEMKILADAPGTMDKSERYIAYVKHTIDFVMHGDHAMGIMATKWADETHPATPGLSPAFEQYASAATELYTTVNSRDYGRASLLILRTLDTVLPKDSILDHDLVKLVTLAADIAEAQSGEVQDIFEAAIMPVGSYRVKQSTHFSTSINAYPGLFGGWETLQGTNSTKYFGGVAGPIGIAISTSRGNERTLRASNSLFINFIDIGALLTYRFDAEDSVSASPQVTFANVFAPGLFAIHGIKGSPLSYGVGVQYAPRLRGVTTDAIDLAPADAIRVGFLLAVDIPLFPLTLKRRQVGSVVKELHELEKELAGVTNDPKKERCLKKRIACKRASLAQRLED